MTGWLALCLMAFYLNSLIFDYKLLKVLFYLDITWLMDHALKVSWQFSYVVWSLHALTGSSCPAQLLLLCLAFRSDHDNCMFCMCDIWYIDTWFHCLILLFDWIAFGFLWCRCHWNWYSFLDHYCIYHKFGLILWSLVMIYLDLLDNHSCTNYIGLKRKWYEYYLLYQSFWCCWKFYEVLLLDLYLHVHSQRQIPKGSVLMVIGISSLGNNWATWCQSWSLFLHLLTLEQFLHLPLHLCKLWWCHLTLCLVAGIVDISMLYYQGKLRTLWLDFHWGKL